MKRLIRLKTSNFNTFEKGLQTSLDDLVKILKGDVTSAANESNNVEFIEVGDIENIDDDDNNNRYENDSRLNANKAILYLNNNPFGGIYREINDTKNGENLFAVECVCFKDVTDTKIDENGKQQSFFVEGIILGIVASKIDYSNIKKPIIDNNVRYSEVRPNFSSVKEAIDSVKNVISIRGLSLKYVASSFEETAKILVL